MNRPLRHNADLALTRRSFFVATLAAGAVFGLGRAAALAQPAPPLTGYAPTIWFRIDRDGLTWIRIAKAEMGQHIGTAMARILADELEADWDSVRLVSVDSDPKWGPMVTGGSRSVWQTYPLFSRAGAAGRIALIEAGAALLDVSPSACIAKKGRVEAGDRSIGYGEIVQRGKLEWRFSDDDLQALPIKTPDKWTLIGRDGRSRHSRQNTGRGDLRHRRRGGRHGLRSTETAADTLRLHGPFDRRHRSPRGERISGQHRARGPVGHSPRLGHGDRQVLSGRDPGH
jgi:isoquinoline 1-oxidoreductase beta subunit